MNAGARVAACIIVLALMHVSCKKEAVDLTEPPVVSVTPIPVAPPVLPPPDNGNAPSTDTDTAVPSRPPTGRTLRQLDLARAAAVAGNAAEVKSLLYARAHTGGAPEEGRMVREACKQLHDQACVDEMKAKYP